MHDCVKSLLNQPDEEDLECLCRLITTVGIKMDDAPSQQLMDAYFDRVKRIARISTYSSRIRFSLQNLIDFEGVMNGFPRREKEGENPKTIEEVHKQAAMEQYEAQRQREKERRDLRGMNSNRGGQQMSYERRIRFFSTS